jgi:hypothetical protein
MLPLSLCGRYRLSGKEITMETNGSWERLFFSQKPFFSYLGMAYILGFLGFACIVVGIVSEAIRLTLGLEPVSWFLVGIGSFILGLWFWLEWAFLKIARKDK